MLKINDYVVFGSNGVCQIINISRESFGGLLEREYYILNPLFTNCSTIYVPIDNQSVKIRKILTRNEISQLMEQFPEDSEWIADDHSRRTAFTDAIQSGEPMKLVQLIHSTNRRKEELAKLNKKLTFSDEESMKTAEKLLHNELALALNIQPDEVPGYLLDLQKP